MLNFAASTVRPDFVSLHTAVKYVAGAYVFVMAVILIYFVIMAMRQGRNSTELAELRKLVEERDAEQSVAGATGLGAGSTAEASAAAADDHERAAEAIRSEHQL